MTPKELNYIVPASFDKSLNTAAWDDVKPSQALLSNKEQIYTQYPELQQVALTSVPPSLLDREKAQNGPFSNMQASACELNKALVPPIQKFMVN